MGRIFFLSPPTIRGSLTLGWRALCHSRGALLFFFNYLDVHRGSGIPKAAPTGVSDPRLMAFFTIQLTQGPNLRFPNLHVTQAIEPQLGAPSARGAKTCHVRGRLGVGGRWLPSATAESRWVCAPHTHIILVCHARRGRSRKGGGGGGRTPMGGALSNVLNTCSRRQQQPGIFC